MSMRTQIHDAVDEVAPPAPSLERSVTAFVFADGRDRRGMLHGRGRARWTLRFRGYATLVAAALVLLLVGGSIIGVRIWRDWANHSSSPASSINQSELHDLESRPFVLPTIQPGAVCPYTDPLTSYTPTVRGVGPIYLINALTVGRTAQGDWFAPTFYNEAKSPGLVLVRARDLVTNQRFVFAQYSLWPSAAIAEGPVVGTDQLAGKKIQLHPEVVLPDPSQLRSNNQELVGMFAVPRATLCWGFQFDGPGFTETYVNGWDTLADKGP